MQGRRVSKTLTQFILRFAALAALTLIVLAGVSTRAQPEPADQALSAGTKVQASREAQVRR
ncbi:MAG: hypothetical protein ACT4PG_00230 [Panacagrimonas sp.]